MSVWIHFDRQKKRRSTKEKMERPTPIKTEQAWNTYVYPVAADDDLFIDGSRSFSRWPCWTASKLRPEGTLVLIAYIHRALYAKGYVTTLVIIFLIMPSNLVIKLNLWTLPFQMTPSIWLSYCQLLARLPEHICFLISVTVFRAA